MSLAPLIEFDNKKKPTWEAYQVSWADDNHNKLPPIFQAITNLDLRRKKKRKEKRKTILILHSKPKQITDNPNLYASIVNVLNDQNNKKNEITNLVSLVEKLFSMKECRTTFLEEEKHATNCTPIEAAWKRAVKCLDGCSHDDDKIW
ncbi:hypothetical protein G9A89_017342 [Geosiphon pyriformis]|nr:hypothetical protein G9A89_017342 [Geosiphon pyriformis]